MSMWLSYIIYIILTPFSSHIALTRSVRWQFNSQRTGHLVTCWPSTKVLQLGNTDTAERYADCLDPMDIKDVLMF